MRVRLVTQELVTQIKHDGALFEVERFKEQRYLKKRRELLIQWFEFESEDDTWEPFIQIYTDVHTKRGNRLRTSLLHQLSHGS